VSLRADRNWPGQRESSFGLHTGVLDDPFREFAFVPNEARDSSRPVPAGSTARSMNMRCRKSRSFTMRVTSLASFKTIGLGVPAGANSPNQVAG
jgi:hypothetical protein